MRNVLSRVRAGIARATRRVTRRAASGGRTSGS